MKKLLLLMSVILHSSEGTNKGSGAEASLMAIINSMQEMEQGKLWSFFKLLGNTMEWEDSIFSWYQTSPYERYTMSPWSRWLESIYVEVFLKSSFRLIGKLLDMSLFQLQDTSTIRIITPKNHKSHALKFSEEDEKKFQKMLDLVEMGHNNKRAHKNSAIYIYGPPGVGKTHGIIHKLIQQSYTIYYINTSSILFGNYEGSHVTRLLNDLWLKVRDKNMKGEKIVIVIDECESFIQPKNRLMDETSSILANALSENALALNHALTVFCLGLLSERRGSVIFISNEILDKNGRPHIAPEMSRRFHYVFKISLPNLSNLTKIWEFFLASYNIRFLEGAVEDIIYYLGELSYKHKVSARDIKTYCQMYGGQTISVVSLCNLIKKSSY